MAPQFWTGRTGRFLRDSGRDAQVVAFYLLTAPSANMIGLYYLALPTLCHEVGISRQGASKALRRASEGGFAGYDEATETVWIPEMARFQVGESLKPKDNRIVGIVREADSVRNSPFIIEFYEKYRERFHLPEEGPWKGLRRASEGASKPLRSQEQDQDQEQEQDLKHSAPENGAPLVCDFDHWYELYPLKDGRKPAAEQYRAALKRGATAQQLLDGLKLDIERRDQAAAVGEFVPSWPMPKTWLRQDRHRDLLAAPAGATPRAVLPADASRPAWLERLRDMRARSRAAFDHVVRGRPADEIAALERELDALPATHEKRQESA